MKIVVVYKWAANPQEASVAPDGAVDWSRAKPGISDYDVVPIAVGRALADATGAELIGVSVGGPEVAGALAKKAALSRRLDRLALVADDSLAGAGTTQTAFALASVIESIGDVDLVLAGDSSEDVGAQMVPAVLAGALGWPALAQVGEIEATDGGFRVTRSLAGGTQVLQVDGPAVLSIAPGVVSPPVPGMKDILAAGKKPADVIGLDSLGVPELVGVEVVAQRKPELLQRKHKIVTASDPAAAATELVADLRADQVI